jgi:hypothetical protein
MYEIILLYKFILLTFCFVFACYEKLSGLVLIQNVVAFVFCYDKTDETCS